MKVGLRPLPGEMAAQLFVFKALGRRLGGERLQIPASQVWIPREMVILGVSRPEA